MLCSELLLGWIVLLFDVALSDSRRVVRGINGMLRGTRLLTAGMRLLKPVIIALRVGFGE